MPAPKTASTTYRKGASNSGQAYGNQQELRDNLQAEAVATEKGYLLAWDPKTQTEKMAGRLRHSRLGRRMLTAGNILVQGTISKTVAIYRATDGKKLWEMNVDRAAVAGPITYMIDGEQYIALNAGWGGSPVYNLNKNGPFRTKHRQVAGVQARRQGRDPAADAAAIETPRRRLFARMRSSRFPLLAVTTSRAYTLVVLRRCRRPACMPGRGCARHEAGAHSSARPGVLSAYGIGLADERRRLVQRAVEATLEPALMTRLRRRIFEEPRRRSYLSSPPGIAVERRR